MSSKLDMPLGDIITAERSEQRSSRGGGERGGRGGGRGGRAERGGRTEPGGRGSDSSRGGGPTRHRDERRGGRRDGPYASNDRDNRRVDPDAEFSRPQSSQQPSGEPKVRGDTIFVSNLDRDVNQEDVYDIFSRVGPVRSAIVNYDQSGASLGKAEVVFNSARDAESAVREYDGAEVDGRVMNVKLIGSFVRQPQVVKKQQPPPVQSAPATRGRQDQPGRQKRDVEPARRQPKEPKRGGEQAAAPRGRGEKRGGRGGRGGGRGGGRSAGEKPTAESLDAEMDAYRASSVATTATNGAEASA